MSYATLPDGSPLPTFLTQSPNTPFTVGKVQYLQNKFYAYSGMVDFDLTVAVTYPLLNFTLERDSIIKPQFSCNFDLIDATGTAVGWLVSIDGIEIYKWVADAPAEYGVYHNPTLLIPANRECNIAVMNPDASADLLQANCSLVGEYV